MGADYVEIDLSIYDYKNMKKLETLFYSSYRVGGCDGNYHESEYTVYDVFDNIKNGLPIPFNKSDVHDYDGLCYSFENIKNGKAIPKPLTDQKYLDEFLYGEIKFDGKKLNDFLNDVPYFDFNKLKKKYKNHDYICILLTREMG